LKPTQDVINKAARGYSRCSRHSCESYLDDGAAAIVAASRFPSPKKLEKDQGFLVSRPQLMAGRTYDETTLLALVDALERAIGLKERPPLEKFVAEKNEFLKDEKFPNENKLYTD
jgi:hypothetical protein